MDVSFLSLLTFILTTIGYFVIGKQKLIINDGLDNNANLEGFPISSTDWLSGITAYYYSTFPKLGLYLLAVTLVQFMLNLGYLIGKCGGNVGNNLGPAILFTFIPWTLIFGVMIAALVVFPGFKSAFSDVIGYFVISSSAHDLLSQILIDVDVDKAMASSSLGDKTQEEMKLAADTIMKVCGNKGILINEMNPENFINIWNIMKPLTKFGNNNQFTDKLTGQVIDINTKRQELLDLVTLKDNIGEAFWYIYTAILVSSIVYYNLGSRGCVKDVATIQSDHAEYVKEQEAIEKKKEVENQVTYTMS